MTRSSSLGRVTIAGIGPGASVSLLTTAAYEAIRTADLVIYSGVMIGDELRALVTGTLMVGSHFDDETIRRCVLEAVSSGQYVAWLEPGDPSFYSGEPGVFSSFASNVRWLRQREIPTTIIPGVSSLQALTARLGLEHASTGDGGLPLLVYAPGRDPRMVALQRLEALCSLRAPIALFLSIERIEDIVATAQRHFGLEGRMIIGYRIGWPDEVILDTTLGEALARLHGKELRRHALVLIGPWRGG
jgi:precorrin-4/cobalt-precorrin-4 C11-methyltransferase